MAKGQDSGRGMDMTPEEARDLDETRRLLYCAIASRHTKRYQLAGTLMNALLHHQGHDGSAAHVLVRNVINLVDPDDTTDADEWADDRIEEITQRLAAPAVEEVVDDRPRGYTCGVCGHDLVQIHGTFRHGVPGFAGQTYDPGHSVAPVPKGMKITYPNIPGELVAAVTALDEVLRAFDLRPAPGSRAVLRSRHTAVEVVDGWRRHLARALAVIEASK
jgi:hypothetical protein